ncbi:S-adenosyl-L-methionine-dependent methyltransferase [Mycena venus]|uniref:S-adenosyl-L-methionine-dependent methyltransferase n=1 Tax=Mycena venus TaxID=2733690 RepID=A0A8H6Y631_9AGAR|nr:S-adenosyl-L-methionine-dependent methyltransferase [Mycena venus]
MASEILQLSNIISSSVHDLLELSKTNNRSLPVLNESFAPNKDVFRENPEASLATAKIIAASVQLATTLMPPGEAILAFIAPSSKAAALRVCLECNVPEILREAGPQGLHVMDITQKSGSKVDSDKLTRVMRSLANSHVFCEVKPDVFAHTMHSSVLDTGKHIEEILENPEAKHDGTRGFAAFYEYAFDDFAKASTVLVENMIDPKTAFSDSPVHAPIQRAFKHNLTLYEWYELPENAYRRCRFGIGMMGVAAMRGNEILSEFDWTVFPKGLVVVDVSGGFGASAKFLATHAPHVNIIIQDKPEVAAAGMQAWQGHSSDPLESKRVIFQSHDFFDPQPVKQPAGFILKNIIHNWGDSYSLKILTHLRAAASPDTKLFIAGVILQYLCPSSNDSESAPEPLLPSYGAHGEHQYMLDIISNA